MNGKLFRILGKYIVPRKRIVSEKNKLFPRRKYTPTYPFLSFIPFHIGLDLPFELITFFFCVSHIMALRAPSPRLPLYLLLSLLLMSHGHVRRDTHPHACRHIRTRARTRAHTHAHGNLALKLLPCPSKVPAHPLPHTFIERTHRLSHPSVPFPRYIPTQIHT